MPEGGGMFLCGSCCVFVTIPAIILIILSFATLEPVEYGLNFNAITMSLENTTYSVAGLYFLGFGHWFIRFPRIIQTIEFLDNAEGGLLHTREHTAHSGDHAIATRLAKHDRTPDSAHRTAHIAQHSAGR